MKKAVGQSLFLPLLIIQVEKNAAESVLNQILW